MSEGLVVHIRCLPEAEHTQLLDLKFELWITAITHADNTLNGQKRQMREMVEGMFNKQPKIDNSLLNVKSETCPDRDKQAMLYIPTC